MSDKKDLSTNVKTVLHGEVLGPEDYGYEPKPKGKAAAGMTEEVREALMKEHKRRAQEKGEAQYRQDMYSPWANHGQNHNTFGGYMGNQMGSQLGGFGQMYPGCSYLRAQCTLHCPSLLGPCKSCGRY